jgi:hypothetical protein
MRGCEGRLRGKGEGVGVAGGDSISFRRMGLMWFPLAPCIAFAFDRALNGSRNKKLSGRHILAGEGWGVFRILRRTCDFLNGSD